MQVRWVRVYHRSLLHHFLQHFKIARTIFWKCPPQWEQHCLRYQSYRLSSIWPLQKLLVTRFLLHDCYRHLYKIVDNKGLIIKVNFLHMMRFRMSHFSKKNTFVATFYQCKSIYYLFFYITSFFLKITKVESVYS